MLARAPRTLIRRLSTEAGAAPVAVEPIAVVQTQNASFFQRVFAFSAGIGVGSLYYLYTVSEGWKNDENLALEVRALRKEAAKVSVEFRQRVALLEAEVSILKKELGSWESGRVKN